MNNGQLLGLFAGSNLLSLRGPQEQFGGTGDSSRTGIQDRRGVAVNIQLHTVDPLRRYQDLGARPNRAPR